MFALRNVNTKLTLAFGKSERYSILGERKR
jgi:hypothetical protein